MYQILSFLKFYVTATNQHGVHSPFVYDYVTKCLYKKERIRLPVSTKVLVKSILYFNYQTVRLLTANKNLEKDIFDHCPNVNFTQENPIVIVGSVNDILHSKILDQKLENRTMLFIDKIHKNQNNFEQWKYIQAHNKVTVTIDLFYCGLVFVRKEQVKEHFKIRI
ncbi:hypothetical protein Q2T41_15655 [Maribacter confluentis]|uniref:Uncharacterized protein n=1 Tax=Maribacter confluentis TaxID=1656093 RepID=A0ABT8RVJ3_9FLAO|nr:hypothetical protein [Maribacter confluentis]MDO1514096.1 hypothetical protein [Maribacter confluentis]